ncbi:hypothetical protein MSAN_00870500 [Mycena sanguinolenta]|uniref:Uncharacterized protein n=1 Tax=Mycena sanguinolenta TaxID=230812 RepID=A0A8H6Z1A9_9AGAR|nr:hypothetical protein MSAN_00870500 [Mycena sanguinolenta]
MFIESVSRDPRLPPELEHRIFEIAALTWPRWIPTLMLVAKRVKFWVEPLLCRVVFLRGPKMDELRNLGLPTFTADALEKRDSTCFHHVTHLFVESFEDPVLEKWLLACPSTTNLFAQFDSSPETLPFLSRFTNIRYLAIDVQALLGTDLPFPLFLTVTHLELFNFGTDAGAGAYRNIALIPRLTHLALNPHLDSCLPHAELCANTQLRCIVFLSVEASLHGSPLLRDDRFVCIDEDVSYEIDWLHGAVFGEDYWSLADNFLADRRAGNISPSQYRISNRRELREGVFMR